MLLPSSPESCLFRVSKINKKKKVKKKEQSQITNFRSLFTIYHRQLKWYEVNTIQTVQCFLWENWSLTLAENLILGE